MTTSVSEFLTRVSRDLHETSNAFLSGAWTLAEMLSYLTQAERRFLHAAGIWKIDTTVVLAAGSSILINRPASTMDIDRVSVNGRHIKRQTSYDFELEDRHWRENTAGKPSYWHEDNIPNTTFELNKIPAAGASVRVFADYLPAEYTDMTGNIHLKDCWEPYLRWEVLSLALAKDCEDQDLGRSNYAHKRYGVGIMLARRMIKGIANTGLRG